MKLNNNTHPLIGQVVMVEPFLTRDPAGRRGCTGKVLYIDEANDNVTIQFGNHTTSAYQMDALITLYPLESLKHILHATRGIYTHSESAVLERIYKYASIGNTEKALLTAVFGAYPSEKICTLNCRDYMNMLNEVKALKERSYREEILLRR